MPLPLWLYRLFVFALAFADNHATALCGVALFAASLLDFVKMELLHFENPA